MSRLFDLAVLGPEPASLLFSFISAFAVAVLLIPVVAAFAKRIGWVDRPGGIKTHPIVTPYGGGLGIGLAALVALRLWYPAAWPDFATGLLAGALLIFAGGVWDDLSPMGFIGKFSFQGAAAAIVLFHGIHLEIKIFPDWLNYFLTIFWLVGITNAVNIIDILDGLAGGVCGVAALTFGLIGCLFGNPVSAYLGFALSGAISGFLVYNFHPARIFMGDAGAQLLGFVLGVLAILGAYTAFNRIALLAPLLVLGVPIFDTALVIAIRSAKGKSPFLGSPDHFALRLRAIGLSVPKTVRIMMLATLVLSTAALLATLVPLGTALLIYGVTLIIAVGFGAWLAQIPVPEARKPLPGDIRVIGITGLIGSGKSTVSSELVVALSRRGERVLLLDADRIVTQLFERDQVLLERLAGEFGSDILGAEGALDRALLASRAFATDESARRINAIIHPAVIAESRCRIEQWNGRVILDVPLLFESGMDELCDVILVVTAPAEIRRSRTRFTDFAERERHQWPDERKIPHADIVIENSGSTGELKAQVSKAAEKILST